MSKENEIRIIQTETGVTLQEANPIYLEYEEKVWQDYLRRKLHADMVMERNRKRRQKNT